MPNATALVTDQGILTYAELDRRATALAAYLFQLGVGPERLVGLCLDRSFALVIGLIATLKAGGAYLPLDPAYPVQRLATMLGDAQPAVLLTQPHLLSTLPPISVPVVQLNDAGTPTNTGQNLSLISGPSLPPSSSSLAYLIFTSGSTGTPKGVLIENRGISNVVAEQIRLFGIREGDRVLQFASLSFDAATFEIAMALGSGAALCLGSRDVLGPGPPLTDFLRRHQVSVATLPPSALAALSPSDLPDLRVVTVAGEACPAHLVSKWAPGRRFFNLYGPTEATIWATASRCVDGTRRPSIGGPIANVQCHVVDRIGQLVPIGVVGELWLGGIGIARGYLNRADLTAERFIPDPFNPRLTSRLYRTGDLVRRRADGSSRLR